MFIRNTPIALVLLSAAISTVHAAEYQPAESLLETKADRSNQLYVSPEFNFDNQRRITLDLMAFDDQGDPLINTLVVIKGRASESRYLDEEPQSYELVSMLRTDDSGAVYREVELADQIDQLQIQVQTVGIENVLHIELIDDDAVYHTFE